MGKRYKHHRNPHHSVDEKKKYNEWHYQNVVRPKLIKEGKMGMGRHKTGWSKKKVKK